MAAIRTGLGADPGPPPAAFGAPLPDGLALIPPDLPNRDPLPLLSEADAAATLETSGDLDPETPRAPVRIWRPGADGFAAAAREVAALLAPGDLAWIDARLTPAAAATVWLGCTTGAVETAAGPETRFVCTAPAGQAEGFVAPDGAGRIESLWLGDHAVGRIAVTATAAGRATVLRPPGPAPRLADGRRVAEAVLDGGAVAIRLTDDLGPLAQALRDNADDPALGPGPFDRRAVLRLIDTLTEPPHG
jgi:hypothetical protein